MAVLYMRTKDGGFLAGDPDTGAVGYAYPSSPHSDMAKRRPAEVAREMVWTNSRIYRTECSVIRDETWLRNLKQNGTPA